MGSILTMYNAWIGVGANLGDAADTVRAAIRALGEQPHCRLLTASSLYRTAPISAEGQPDYVNAVVLLDTALGPTLLLETLLAVEKRFGRVRTTPNAARTLDLDLLMYDQRVIDHPGLVVPHPRMHERAFVLRPLAEISPDLHIPGHGPIQELLVGVADQRIKRIED
ncbi:2-amino-4-hydroxy-6-hydroxymethyldihydropteridine diphosphokinase [Uliginosibacterium sp. sgz301328]|uniref:2-amino-4-hydroxy-6- hydroxymethyldihydropteridine diphosphokinase n=1 Tax=Uliginosibacterium sp. sgz301328 TaxID=3243764 RepID=UPI00359DC3A1